VSKAFDDRGKKKVILDNFYYNFARFEKMGIVGNNGTGKSTFIKMLLGEVQPDSGKFDIGDVWSRRTEILNDSDSIKTQKFNPDSNLDFVYMLVYNPDSVNENQLLFEIAKYNFTSYMVRNFDIQIENIDNIHRMVIKGFLNYNEALQYARELHKQTAVITLAQKARPIIISRQNIPLLGNQFSYEDYEKFYNKNFAPIKTTTSNLLTEPTKIVTVGNEDEVNPLPKAEKKEDKKTEDKTFNLEDEYYDLEGF
jgi:ABC-type dipeptide/oligopeptide/nickel transport system ATPase component